MLDVLASPSRLLTTKVRRLDAYHKTLEEINDLATVDVKQTKGIQMGCALNDLKYFHILKNCTVGIMHDLNEGIVPFLNVFDSIEILFNRRIKKKI